MRIYDLIKKKRDGGTHSKAELRFLIDSYVSGDIPDYQISAWLMAVYFQGMSSEETLDFTQALVESGDQVDLSSIEGVKVDKHSTGGVGDKTSLIVGPIVAACGLKLAKMSGRGLGHTGGTLDKLEAIPGLSTELSEQEFIEHIIRVSASITFSSSIVTLYGAFDKSALVAKPKRISAPKRSACFFKSSINSGPVIPSG